MEKPKGRYEERAFLPELPHQRLLGRLLGLHRAPWELENVEARDPLGRDEHAASAKEDSVDAKIFRPFHADPFRLEEA